MSSSQEPVQAEFVDADTYLKKYVLGNKDKAGHLAEVLFERLINRPDDFRNAIFGKDSYTIKCHLYRDNDLPHWVNSAIAEKSVVYRQAVRLLEDKGYYLTIGDFNADELPSSGPLYVENFSYYPVTVTLKTDKGNN